MRLPALAASFAALSIIACSAAPSDDAASSDSAQTSIKALSVVKGREFARCWMQSSDLVCQSTKRAENDPLASTMKVFGLSGMTPFIVPLDLENGGTVTVAHLSEFPVTFFMSAKLPPSAQVPLGMATDDTITAKVTVTGPGSISQASPTILEQPFDLWPTGLIGDADRSIFAVNARYTFSIAPYADSLDGTEWTADVGFISSDFKGKIRYWVKPASGEIAISNGGPVGSIKAPGYYTMTRNGLRAATPEEILRDYPNAGDSTPDPVVEDGGSAPDATPAVDAGPPDLTPGCGGNGEARCPNGSCDPGARYDSNSGKCVSCGGVGQTYCLDANGRTTCNEGNRYDSNSGKCLACGNDGETYCLDANGRTTCNDGNRYDSNAGKCLACGNDGQTYCLDSNGHTSCNAGARYDSNSGKCVSCGNAGQTYCLDANGQTTCNPGNRYDSNSGKCVAQ